MTRLLPYELLLYNLRQEVSKGVSGFMPQQLAYEMLKELSHEDFGLNYDLWEEWVSNNHAVFKDGKAWSRALKTAETRLNSTATE